VVVIGDSTGTIDGSDVADGGIIKGGVAVVARRVGLVTVWMGVFRDSSRGFVDLPAFFCSRDRLSLGSVCVAVLAVEVGAVWVLESVVTLFANSICTPLSISTFCSCVRTSVHLLWPCVVVQVSRSAILPCSSPFLQSILVSFLQ
jgi:hypothetical protein